MLKNYHWPGNARELENVIKRAAIFTRVDTIGAHNIEFSADSPAKADQCPPAVSIENQVSNWFENRSNLFPDEKRLYSTLISAVGKTLISRALEVCGDNQLKASELLGMNRPP